MKQREEQGNSWANIMSLRLITIRRGFHPGPIASALTLLMLSSYGFSSSYIDRGVDELFLDSSDVIAAKIVGITAECAGSGCLTTYIVRSDVIYKGELDKGSEARVCSSKALPAGQDFVFFLHQLRDKEGCDYGLHQDSVFLKGYDDVYRYGSQGSFRVIDMDGKTYVTNSVVEEGFTENLMKAFNSTNGER